MRNPRFIIVRDWDSGFIREAIDVGLTLEDGRVYCIEPTGRGDHAVRKYLPRNRPLPPPGPPASWQASEIIEDVPAL